MCEECVKAIRSISDTDRFKMTVSNQEKAAAFVDSIDVGEGGFNNLSPEENKMMAAVTILSFLIGHRDESQTVSAHIPEALRQGLDAGSLQLGADIYKRECH